MKYKTYPEYIDSGVEWIGEIPENWDLIRNKNIFSKSKKIVGEKWNNYNVLSLTMKGVIKRNIESNMGKMPSDFGIYQIVEPGNLLLCLFDIDVTPRCVGYVNDEGIVSGAYSQYSPTKDNIKVKFYYYWYLMLDFDKKLLHLSKNLRNSIGNDEFMSLPIVLPSIEEQIGIVNFIEKEISKIDLIIEKYEKLIELLKEKRIALISHVVTKGLDKNVEMKDSGVEWIGEIPEHWKISKIRYESKKVMTGKTPPSEILDYYDENGLDWFAPSDFSDNFILEQSKKKISELTISEGIVPIYNPQSVLIVGIGATIGKVGINEKKCSSNQQINAIEFNLEKIHSNFGLYFLFASKKFIINNSNSSTIGIFNKTQTENLSILKPPLTEQKEIIIQLNKSNEKINILIEKIQSQITLLKEYKISLISHAVTGKIDVREQSSK